MVDVVNMVKMNNSGTLVGSPYETVDGGKIRPSLQYGWSGWLVNIPIHTLFDLCDGMQIEVTPRNGSKKVGREEV